MVVPRTLPCRLSDGSTIKYALALWAAGIGTLDFVKEASEAIPAQAQHAGDARGRLAVDRWTRVIGAPGMFAFGDCAHVVDNPYPATAQVASQAGTYLGRLIADGYDMEAEVPRLAEGAPGTPTLRNTLSTLGEDKGLAPPFTFVRISAGRSTGRLTTGSHMLRCALRCPLRCLCLSLLYCLALLPCTAALPCTA